MILHSFADWFLLFCVLWNASGLCNPKYVEAIFKYSLFRYGWIQVLLIFTVQLWKVCSGVQVAESAMSAERWAKSTTTYWLFFLEKFRVVDEGNALTTPWWRSLFKILQFCCNMWCSQLCGPFPEQGLFIQLQKSCSIYFQLRMKQKMGQQYVNRANRES